MPIDNQNRSALMEIIEDRHNKASVIITSQLPVNCWHEVIGEKTIADAILDRIVHDAHRIEPVSYTHLRAHETDSYIVCRLLLEKKKKYTTSTKKKIKTYTI